MDPDGHGHGRGEGSSSNKIDNEDLLSCTPSTTADLAFQPGSVSSAGGFRNVQFATPGRRRAGGVGDDDASSQFIDGDEEQDPLDAGRQDMEDWPPLHRRRSSVGARLVALTDLGGVNSIRSFARSFQRAANFTEVIPQRPSFIFANDQEPIFGPPRGDASSYAPSAFDGGEVPGSFRGSFRPPPAPMAAPVTSLLRQHLEAGPAAVAASPGTVSFQGPVPQQSEPSSPARGPTADGQLPWPAVAAEGDQPDAAAERKALLDPTASLTRTFRADSASSIFAWPPHLAAASASAAGGVGSPVIGSYGSYRTLRSRGGVYGSVDSAASLAYSAMPGHAGPGSQATSMAEAGALWRQQQQQQDEEGAGGMLHHGDGRPAIRVKEVEEDGKIILTVEGQSTLPQTIFNSINVLIGVGLLSLPMGIKYAGWICGMAVLLLAATITAYTARLLAKCMDLDPAVITFSDLAFISFGPRARLVTSLLFTLELLAACVALIVLFADSLSLLFPGLLSLVEWKILSCVVMVPLNFLPMRLLSVTSIIGIVSCFSIVSIVVIDGLLKRTTPGSLIQPAVTYMFPANWLTLPLSFGLLMSPWGGHSVFPNIYRDMRHPYKYARAVKTTFTFTYLLDAVTAVVGLVMFGDDVKDEITANILTTSGYPRALTILLCICIAIIPLTKIPLNARPIITTAEVLTGLNQPPDVNASSAAIKLRSLAKVSISVLTIVLFLVISILFPEFDSIMAFMGSALCFTICVTLPILFHLKLFGHELSHKEKLFQYIVLTSSIVISLVGTVWSFLPKSLIGVQA